MCFSLSPKKWFLTIVFCSGTVWAAQQPYGQYEGNSQGQAGQSWGGYQNDPAYRRGYDDGVRNAQQDLQRAKRVDPTKNENYEDTPGYNSSYGEKGRWKDQYRQGFVAAYQRTMGGDGYGATPYGAGVNPSYGQRPYDPRDGSMSGYNDDPAYRRGYDDGLRNAQLDSQRGKRVDPTKNENYEDAPGYNSSYGDKSRWNNQYRQGFIAAYQSVGSGDGYGATPYGAGSNAPYGQRPYDPRDGSTSGYNDDPAYRRGYADGLRSAQQDRQKGKRVDPTKNESYEDAPGYSSAYGDKGRWKDQYRQGFMTAYQREMSGGRYEQRPY
ncbi:MAG: hypothetical protein NVS9B15_08230 [Acidobacteriaceae bacterium]